MCEFVRRKKKDSKLKKGYRDMRISSMLSLFTIFDP